MWYEFSVDAGVATTVRHNGASYAIAADNPSHDGRTYVVNFIGRDMIGGSLPDGRYTESIGAVNIANLRGEALANALMKCETKAKRRATLDLLGLGMLDETETDSIPGAERVEVPGGPVAPLATLSSVKPTVELGLITNAQYQDLLAVVRARGLGLARVKSHLASKYGVKTARELTQAQYEELAADLRHMEAAAGIGGALGVAVRSGA